MPAWHFGTQSELEPGAPPSTPKRLEKDTFQYKPERVAYFHGHRKSGNRPRSCDVSDLDDRLSGKACETRDPWHQCSRSRQDTHRGRNSARNKGWLACDP